MISHLQSRVCLVVWSCLLLCGHTVASDIANDKQDTQSTNTDKMGLLKTLQSLLRDRSHRNGGESESVQQIPDLPASSVTTSEKRASTGRCRHPNSMICQALYSTGNKRTITDYNSSLGSDDKRIDEHSPAMLASERPSASLPGAQSSHNERERVDNNLAGMMNDEIDWSKLPPRNPPALARSRRLDDIRRRFQTDLERDIRREVIRAKYERLKQRAAEAYQNLQQRENIELSSIFKSDQLTN